MLYVEVDLGEWCKRHGIQPKQWVCEGCQQEVVCNRPYVTQKSNGLLSDKCGCGKRGMVFVPKPGGSLDEGIKTLFQLMKTDQ